MNTKLALAATFLWPALLIANTAPVPGISSATMRPGTTLMDVVYRVIDPDDATVKVRALAFIDGARSFAKVIRPVTFVEGTVANLGNAITTNVDHTLTWDVAADWNIDVGQVKFEILALDGRGLLQFDWITIPAAGSQPALTISKDTPATAKVLDSLFWLYADNDPGLTLASGVLSGNANNGVFDGLALANGSTPQPYGTAFVCKRMNLDPATTLDVNYAQTTARANLLNTSSWHVIDRPYSGITRVIGWGRSGDGQFNINPIGATDIIAVAAGWEHTLGLRGDGSVVGWGSNGVQQITPPTGLTGATAIAAGNYHSLALKSDGTVAAWGQNNLGQTNVPAGLTGVTKIAAAENHCLVLKNDGTITGWGDNSAGQLTPPDGLTGVTTIATGSYHSLARKSDGTVVAWGSNDFQQLNVPAGLSGVTAVAAGRFHCLALKSDGTVVGWGSDTFGQKSPPPGLSGVTAIAAGLYHSLALKSDGTVVAWGRNDWGQISVPAGLSGVTAIAAGVQNSVALKSKAP